MSTIGWAGAAIVLLGYYLNANKLSWSWLVWLLGNALVAIYSFNLSAYPTAMMSVIIMGMNIYGYIQWKKE